MLLPGVRHADVRVNGVRLHYVERGEGPLLLLLHGFPEFWYAWRHQIPALADAGYRVVAPDLRGYNRSDRPVGVRSYRLETLVADVLALGRALGGEPPVVVGHDWGAVLAWYAAMADPTALRGVVVINGPHPAAYRREVRRLSSQVLRSWYAGFFQLPLLPELLLRGAGGAGLRRALRAGPAREPGTLDAYLQAFAEPGSLTAALNYYRAAARFPAPPVRHVTAPTLVLWGDRDPYLVARLADELDHWVQAPRVEHLHDADHWLHHSHADQVNARILAFLRTLPVP